MPRFHLVCFRGRRYRKHSNTRMTLFLVFLVAFIIVTLPLYIVYKPPASLIRAFQRRWPDVIWQVSTTKSIIALTIDDAPSAHTREIMQILAANNATATFFIIGSQVPGHEETLTDLVKGGHELANHGMHDEPARSLTNAELLGQISTVQHHISNAYEAANVTQPSTKAGKYLFRPGSGFFSTRMRQAMATSGYQIALGGIYPHDPQVPYWRVNVRHILSGARPGAVVICHDRREWTAPMLRKVLPELRRRGYRVVGLHQLMREGDVL